MLPPPPDVYSSADELLRSAQMFANSQGYALVKKRTRKNESDELKNMSLRCDRGGIYNNSLELKEKVCHRQKSTRLIDCPFELYAAQRDGLWHLKVRNISHNYDASQDMSGHPIVHRLTEQQMKSVKAMTIASSQPKAIVTTLQQSDSSVLVTNSDIYNAHARLQQQNLADHTPIQALVDELQNGNFLYEYECDDTGETEEDYKWALTCVLRLFDRVQMPGIVVTDRELALINALSIVFPSSANLLCVWHISKNVLKNCKPLFPKEMNNEESTEWQDFLSRWNDIVESETEKEFNTKWRDFRSTYANKSTAITYLEIPGYHGKKGSIGDLHQIHATISLVVNNQKKELDSMVVTERIHIPVFATNNILYANVKGKVSIFALKKINKQDQRLKNAIAQNSLPTCTGSFTKTMGLSCAYTIELFKDNQSFTLDDIYKHWWIPEHLQQRYQEWPESRQLKAREKLKNIIDTQPIILQNPNVVHAKGHSLGTPNQQTNSTRRDLSGFELVDHKAQHCTLCQQPGHNAHTCLNGNSSV
ncbi:4873_t:CDS:2 [Cetraspora pellucida]|uniref:4873_t:CDS:1 n=1 Tax=Cetraspora pellucida TaxID=1433469 RepID=A0A9N9I381_9GLOM|nr:4873_t:CDS:2 [Cetraspora pellucida]